MALEVKQFNCPSCGSPLNIQNAGRSKSLVCPTCHSQIDLTKPEYQVIGSAGNKREPLRTPFAPGMKGTLNGEEHMIIGRVTYQQTGGESWDEWLLLTASGDYRWISDGENEGLILWHIFMPPDPLDPNTVKYHDTIHLHNEAVTIGVRDDARIVYLEGELTWKAKVGDAMAFLDGKGAGGDVYSIEWTGDEVEFYWGKPQDERVVRQAFGLQAAVVRPLGADFGGPTRAPSGMAVSTGTGCGTIAKWIIIAAFVLFVFFACIAILPSVDSGTSGTTGGSFPAGSSYRPSSSSSHSSTSSSGPRSSGGGRSSGSYGGGK